MFRDTVYVQSIFCNIIIFILSQSCSVLTAGFFQSNTGWMWSPNNLQKMLSVLAEPLWDLAIDGKHNQTFLFGQCQWGIFWKLAFHITDDADQINGGENEKHPCLDMLNASWSTTLTGISFYQVHTEQNIEIRCANHPYVDFPTLICWLLQHWHEGPLCVAVGNLTHGPMLML